MSDDFEPFATAGSGKSEAEVAFDLLNKLKGQGVWGERNKPAILDMYAECLDAVKGLRAYEGQNRVEPAIRRLGPATAQQTPAQPALTQTAPAAPPMPQAQPATAQAPLAQPNAAQPQAAQAPANPVQTQQQQLQQQILRQG